MESFNTDGYRRSRNKNDIPSTPHYAIIEFRNIYIPGDERSQTNPGHGYPAHTETTSEYIVFKDKESWEAYIKINKMDDKVAFLAHPAAITVQKFISIK